MKMGNDDEITLGSEVEVNDSNNFFAMHNKQLEASLKRIDDIKELEAVSEWYEYVQSDDCFYEDLNPPLMFNLNDILYIRINDDHKPPYKLDITLKNQDVLTLYFEDGEEAISAYGDICNRLKKLSKYNRMTRS